MADNTLNNNTFSLVINKKRNCNFCNDNILVNLNKEQIDMIDFIRFKLKTCLSNIDFRKFSISLLKQNLISKMPFCKCCKMSYDLYKIFYEQYTYWIYFLYKYNQYQFEIQKEIFEELYSECLKFEESIEINPIENYKTPVYLKIIPKIYHLFVNIQPNKFVRVQYDKSNNIKVTIFGFNNTIIKKENIRFHNFIKSNMFHNYKLAPEDFNHTFKHFIQLANKYKTEMDSLSAKLVGYKETNYHHVSTINNLNQDKDNLIEQINVNEQTIVNLKTINDQMKSVYDMVVRENDSLKRDIDYLRNNSYHNLTGSFSCNEPTRYPPPGFS